MYQSSYYVNKTLLFLQVNSWAHMFGSKPYNSRIVPVEASIRHVLVGEGKCASEQKKQLLKINLFPS